MSKRASHAWVVEERTTGKRGAWKPCELAWSRRDAMKIVDAYSSGVDWWEYRVRKYQRVEETPK